MDRIAPRPELNESRVLQPRLLNRKDAARYMGVCVRTFDRIRHRFRVEIDGVVRYDRVALDFFIDLSKDDNSS